MNRNVTYWFVAALTEMLLIQVVIANSNGTARGREKRQAIRPFPMTRELSPGVVVHLGPSGVNAIRLTMAKMITTMLPNLKIRKVFQGRKGRKNILVTDLIVRTFNPPDDIVIDFRSDSPNQMIISINPFDLTATMNIRTDYRFLKFATFHLSFNHVSLMLGLRFMASQHSIMLLAVGECEFVLKDFRLSYSNLVGSKGPLKLALPIIRNKLKRFINENFCGMLRNGTELSFNTFIRQFPVFMPIVPNKHYLPVYRRPRSIGLLGYDHLPTMAEKFVNIAKRLFMDVRMLNNPIVVDDVQGKHLEATLSGRILWNRVKGAPFNPNPLPGIATQSNKMLYICISEYVFNSLLFHLFDHGLFNIKYDGSESKETRMMLRTSCDDICIGLIVPQMEKKYPNQHTVFKMKMIKQPLIELRPYGMILKIHGIASFVLENRTHYVTLLSGDMIAESKLHMKLAKDQVYGTAEIIKFSFTPDKSMKLNSLSLDILNDAPRILAEKELNNLLSKGFKIPHIPIMKLFPNGIMPSMNSLLVEMDFSLNPSLSHMLMQYMRSYYASPRRI
ncbi:unnamed protein product [Soboliphyme baturini]|uniref:BPI2 domain-containing protein n=1 Tax=Soboliphyme baturini TaxID=241478 RepID=A0A183IJF7_9BILA|nr:unnamed protein product [Soboliphyme baturini]